METRLSRGEIVALLRDTADKLDADGELSIEFELEWDERESGADATRGTLSIENVTTRPSSEHRPQ